MKKVEKNTEDLGSMRPADTRPISDADLQEMARKQTEENALLLAIIIKPFTPSEDDGLGR